MPGAFISKEKIEGLAQDVHTARSPQSVISILQHYEVEVMGRLQPDNLHPADAEDISRCMSFEEIYRSVRSRVWNSTALPETFPKMLRSFREKWSDRSQSDIGVVTENDADVQAVQEWIQARLKDTSISFEPRGWFDGPASIDILQASDIPPELLEILRQEK